MIKITYHILKPENTVSSKFVQYSIRFYGEPKLSKPKELKSIKQAFSIDYIFNKCKCPIYIKGNDVWIHHKDYFSQNLKTSNINDIGTYLSVKNKKFIYSDAWGSIVLRNEAWICIKNLIKDIKENICEIKILNEIVKQQERICKLKENELICSDMEKFWEKVIYKTKKYITL